MNELAALKAAGIKTYIIGLGAGVDPSVNPAAAQTLTAMAVAAGTGTYFPASSTTALTQDMEVILASILAASQSTAAVAVNSTGLNNGLDAYLAKFNTSDTYQDWTGNLTAYPVSVTTGQVTTGAALWSAQTQLDAQSWNTGRFIATWDPVALQGTPFRWNPSLAPDGISGATASGTQLQTFTADTSGQHVVNYLRGNSAQEQRNGGQFRNRTHKLGDIVASSPLYVGAPSSFSSTASYTTFANKYATRPAVVYVGANDGMLHAFDAATGNERFAYIPNGVYSNLINLVSPYYNEQHRFYVNGSPQAADVQFSDNSWHTELVGVEGAGGKSVYALDVSNPAGITNEATLASNVLWDFTDANMGYGFSEPNIANTSAGWLVFFGNGYDSASQTPYLYALNPQTGAVFAKLNLCAMVANVCNGATTNGLSNLTIINTFGEATFPQDLLYAGDLQGNLWRVDISDANPANWVVSVVYQARDASNNPQPITATPAVTLNPSYPLVLGTMVFVGTGELLSITDLTNTQTQTLYGVFDPPTGSTPPLGFNGIPTRSNLVKQTLASATVNGVAVRVETSVNTVTLPTQRGWYVDYNLLAGERIVSDPQLVPLGGVLVTSYQPSSSPCTNVGQSYLSVFNYATGGSFTQPEFDLNGDGKFNSSDQVIINGTAYNPVGLSLGGYAPEASLVASASGTGVEALTPQQSAAGGITGTGLRSGGKKRIGWWEVRQ